MYATYRFFQFVLVLLAMPLGVASAADTDRIRFDGEGNGRTAVFEVDGPWMLDWSLHSNTPSRAIFEMRLHDGASGAFIGRLMELHGTGNGLKLFEQGGTFQIAIVASQVGWELEVSEVSEEKAAQIKRLSAGEPTLQDSVEASLRLVREGTFSQWRPDGDSALLLFDSGGFGWRATFAEPCPGLESATAISFVTPAKGSMDDYDSILLDDGTQCYFDRVIPTVLE
ncbi:MAG: hypothetical protein KJO09_13505 [Gammaproteobacteria bacterium]|nr:hypothetical protein [Gammaproteobacteria bacterium]